MTYDYFYNDESEQYQFLQMPWMLIKDEQFKTIPSDAKILYSLLLNRTSLSKKNGWIDEQGRVYLIYTVDEIKEDLNCGRDKAIKSMQQLIKIGLVKSIRRGLGKPNLIYVKNFATALKHETKKAEPRINTQKSEIPTSVNRLSRLLEVDFADSSNTNTSNTNMINTESESKSKSKSEPDSAKKVKNDMTMTSDDESTNKNIYKNEKEPPQTAAYQSPVMDSSSFKNNNLPTYDYNTYRILIQENIEYDYYLTYRRTDVQLVDELVECMLDVICTDAPTIKIGRENKNREMVRSQYLKIDSTDIDHILDRYKEQHHKITHLHAYLKTMLYTVKQENGHYYTNAVRADGIVW